MRHLMFDIDGTLVESIKFDAQCFLDSVFEVLNQYPSDDWASYIDVTDSGILKQMFKMLDIKGNQEQYALEIKQKFIEKIKKHIQNNPVKPISGAVEFIQKLKKENNVKVSFATGGWRETAILKLKSAGFNVDDIVLFSSDDHYQRVQIMKLAQGDSLNEQVVYFGDGIWDQVACAELDYEFIAVGESLIDCATIPDFLNYKHRFELVS
ncbi:MAG: HAD hydrolase-like protein [Saccharospirillaceae bacterium]|nr:HAD family hydrolase [Pseudomonadales bacterium]NRB80315.1 HAD hydrolase-like protein [Saccharospirillaceae bacterium]